MGSLDGRTALVTGASSGIGAGIAKGLATAGARVLLVARHRDRLGEVAEGFHPSAPKPTIVQADITRDDDLKEIAQAVADLPKLDILVHAAGIYEPMPFHESRLESFDRQWRTNVRAPFVLTQRLLSNFQGDGVIVFVTSIAGHIGFPNSVAYCATKGAEELLSKSLAVELAPKGIRVNAIAPGNIRTPMNAQLFAKPGYSDEIVAATPANRVGDVDDIVPCVLFLVSQDAKYVYGASFVVDGGWIAR